MPALKALKTGEKEKKVKKPKESTQKTFESPSLSTAIDEHIASGIKGRFKHSVGFSPSNTNECPRYMVYTFRGIWMPATHDARVQRIFDVGNDVHTRIVNYFREMGILIAEEYEINLPAYLPIPIRAFVDALIDWGGRKVVEIKSISEAGFAARKFSKRPKDEHYKQIQMYLGALDIETGYVIYESKNTQEILVLEVKRDDKFLEKLYAKYSKIWTQYEAGILPDRPYKESGPTCQQCALKDHCWSDPEGTGE